ncbi:MULTISPECIES: hypothetical protein [unclassified Pseudomonas]|uniref:hypothetical protein n=1 Tax=unclassified Pseudomonas TaxID=196821 RepID=UPI000D919125|nr:MULTISPECIES: hypothetical protein [unclassified Pseudomonas]PYG78489.1 hypothetical protein N428_02908 [Pseudomonas sp. RV120224-01c]PYG82569.1 hypothetical protein N436_02561 [Pseudomonas sp. RV120224-01b]
MASTRNSYHPIGAALLWCDLAAHEADIMQVALTCPEKLSTHFPQWPFLHAYVERIYDAIARYELPAMYLGSPITPDNQVDRAFVTLRHTDLRIWIARYYPDEKPEFLFSRDLDHSQCISLGVHLAQKAELDAIQRELAKCHAQLASLETELAGQSHERRTLSNRLDALATPREASSMVLSVIIASLLDVTLARSSSTRFPSIYKNQSAIVDAIVNRFPSTPGLSKRTLDRKFAEARRHLAQVLER